MQKGALQFRLEEAELRWLTKLFRPHRDPRLAMGGVVSRLHASFCLHCNSSEYDHCVRVLQRNRANRLRIKGDSLRETGSRSYGG